MTVGIIMGSDSDLPTLQDAIKICEEFGVPFTLSTMSVCSIEDVAEHTKIPFWF
ncbi:MAG: AIR carboxylase family protein, partial [Rivularia sp. ALOHA_DT_140]|nr:AIR carboxylase family protein [Rivularia sp. ALOHA_DT_140]